MSVRIVRTISGAAVRAARGGITTTPPTRTLWCFYFFICFFFLCWPVNALSLLFGVYVKTGITAR
jgi:hypothetical protein